MNRHSLAKLGTIRLLVLGLAVLIVPACTSSDGSGGVMTPGGDTETFELRYDGDQDASPNLVGNRTYEAAARFTSTKTAALAGGKLTEVRFFIQTVPDNCKVKVYGVGASTTPGALLYSADVTASVVGAGWNTHVLTSDLTIPNGDLWISIEFSDTMTQPTIGCDPGPAVTDGNWLYDSNSASWDPFFVSVNWNVRGLVEVTI